MEKLRVGDALDTLMATSSKVLVYDPVLLSVSVRSVLEMMTSASRDSGLGFRFAHGRAKSWCVIEPAVRITCFVTGPYTE